MWDWHHGVGACPSRPEDVRGRSLPDDVPPGAAKSPPRWSSGTRDLLRHARVPPARAGGSGDLRIQPSEPPGAPGGPDSRSALGVESSPTGRLLLFRPEHPAVAPGALPFHALVREEELLHGAPRWLWSPAQERLVEFRMVFAYRKSLEASPRTHGGCLVD